MIKRLLSFASVLLCGVVLAAAPSSKNNPVKELDISNFSKGLDSYHDSTILPDGYVQDALNVYFDRQAPVEKRQGYTVSFSSKSYAYQTAWTYTDGTNTTWLIVRASDSIIASNFTSTVLISTVNVNDQTDETNAFGNAYFVDPTQGVYYWDGSSTHYVAGSPKGSIITQFHSRVWVAGQAVPFGNQLYASKFLDGTVWTIGLNPNDPAQFTIGLQDNFDNITALYPFLDTLYVSKYTSMYALYGYDNTNFQNSIIARDCGCVDKGSMQAYNKGIVFVSLRGLEFFDGYSCTRISDPIKNKLDNAIQFASFNTQSWAQSTLADWNAGTFNTADAFSTAEFPPALSLSTATGSFTDNTTANFNSGTQNNTTVGTNFVELTVTNSSSVWDASFEQAGGGTNFQWDSASNPPSFESNVNNCTAQDGTWFARLTGGCVGGSSSSCGFGDNRTITNFGYRIVDLSGNILQDTALPINQNTCTWTQQTVTRNDLAGKAVQFVFYTSATATSPSSFTRFNFIKTARSYTWAGSMSFYETCMGGGGAPGPQTTCIVDNITLGVSTITAGTFTSQTFDTAISSTIIAAKIQTSTISATEPIVTTLETSTDGSSWSNLTTANNTLVNSHRYLRYHTTFTQTVTGGIFGGPTTDANSVLNSATLTYNFTRSSGVFTSQSHALGSVNSFGNFAVANTVSNGSIAFTICTSSNSNMSPETCLPQTANSQILITSNTYINWVATFTATTSTSNVTLNGVTVQWFSGSKALPMASAVYDNRYWLSLVSTAGDSANDAILILNPMFAFSFFDIHAGGLVAVKNQLYHSDSNATGNVYLDNSGFNDNGVAINAYVKTRDYNLGGSQITDTLFDSFWPSAINNGNFVLNFSYFLDKGNTEYSLANVNQNEFASNKYLRIPFPMSSANPGIAQTVAFKIKSLDLNSPMQLEGMTLLYHERPVQE